MWSHTGTQGSHRPHWDMFRCKAVCGDPDREPQGGENAAVSSCTLGSPQFEIQACNSLLGVIPERNPPSLLLTFFPYPSPLYLLLAFL